jgi:hypothetical protein
MGELWWMECFTEIYAEVYCFSWSQDHERAFFDSADWALGKVCFNISSGTVCVIWLHWMNFVVYIRISWSHSVMINTVLAFQRHVGKSAEDHSESDEAFYQTFWAVDMMWQSTINIAFGKKGWWPGLGFAWVAFLDELDSLLQGRDLSTFCVVVKDS